MQDKPSLPFNTLEEQYQWLAENMQDVVWVMGLDGSIIYVSPSVEKLRGFTVEEVMKQSFEELICEGSRQKLKDAMNYAMKKIQNGEASEYKTFRVEQACKNGTTVWTEVNAKLIEDKQTGDLKYIGVTRDITKRVEAEKEIENEKKLLNEILDLTDNIIFITNFTRLSFFNKKFEKLLSDMAIDVSDEFNILEIFEETKESLHMGLLKEGESFIELIGRVPEHKRIVSIFSSSTQLKTYNISISKTSYCEDYLVTLTDITKIKEEHIQIERKAYYDLLTGVYNRNKFTEEIHIEIEKAKRYKHELSLAIIDIDDFKILNDTYGHLIGDEVLIMIANHINSTTRATDVFARWGGEEFVLLLTETSVKKAQNVADKIRKGIEELEHEVAGKITASFGLTQYNLNDDLESFFKRADDALYKTKKEGKNKVTIF